MVKKINNASELGEELRNEKEKYFKDYIKYSKLIKEEAEKFLGEVRVIVFGSILRKGETPTDIDILIISPKLKTSFDKSKARAQIWRRIGFFTPFEFHFATPEEYESWYKLFIDKKKEME